MRYNEPVTLVLKKQKCMDNFRCELYMCQLTIFLIALIASTGTAQIVTDNHDTPGFPDSDLHFQLIEALGVSAGTNLFHSFREFNIDGGVGKKVNNRSSIFTVFNRITGGDADTLGGSIGGHRQSEFYLINPPGVFFGPNLSVDLTDFLAVTNSERFDWGNYIRFQFEPVQEQVVRVAPVAAFGFMKVNRLEIDHRKRTLSVRNEVIR